MIKSKLANRSGFTYLMALMIVMILGIMLGAIGQTWKTMAQREREEELLFRGQQYKAALERWYKPAPGHPPASPLLDLKDLLQHPRSAQTVRYLRRLYPDPVTGKEWAVIKDPNRGISGVYSTSEDKPLKTGGFPENLKEFTGKTRYNEWQFVYVPAGATPPGARQGSGATGSDSVTGSGGTSGSPYTGHGSK